MNLQFPSLADRVQSTFIDAIFLLLLSFGITEILDKFAAVPDWIRIVLFFGLWALYEPICTTTGGTIGNRIKGIRVRQQSYPSLKPNIFQSFIRYIFKVAFGWLSFGTMHFNKERRAIHDFASGSVMIKLGD